MTETDAPLGSERSDHPAPRRLGVGLCRGNIIVDTSSDFTTLSFEWYLSITLIRDSSDPIGHRHSVIWPSPLPCYEDHPVYIMYIYTCQRLTAPNAVGIKGVPATNILSESRNETHHQLFAMSIKTALIGPTRVPAISLGTWSWGDKTWGYKPEDLPQIREAWFACLEAGYPFFDTAEVSGLCDDMESSGGADESNNGWTGPSQ